MSIALNLSEVLEHKECSQSSLNLRKSFCQRDTMMDLCLYHSDKCHFDIVSCDIEKAKIMPRVYAKRLAMCVCSCRKNSKLLHIPDHKWVH